MVYSKPAYILTPHSSAHILQHIMHHYAFFNLYPDTEICPDSIICCSVWIFLYKCRTYQSKIKLLLIVTNSCTLLLFSRGSVCNVLLTSCEDGVCRLWSETLLPEDSLLGGQISENTHSFSSSLPGLAGNKDKIQHALEVQLLNQTDLTRNN